MLNDQRPAKPHRVWLDMLINPTLGSGSEWAKKKESAFVLDQKVRNGVNSLGGTHGCVLLIAQTRTREIEQKIAACIGGACLGGDFPLRVSSSHPARCG
jgi:hypothetical protein